MACSACSSDAVPSDLSAPSTISCAMERSRPGVQIGPADLTHLGEHGFINRLFLYGVTGADAGLGKSLISPADEEQPILAGCVLEVEYRVPAIFLCCQMTADNKKDSFTMKIKESYHVEITDCMSSDSKSACRMLLASSN